MGQPELCKYDPRFFDGGDMGFQDDCSSLDLDALLSSGDNGQSINALPFELGWDLNSSSGDNGDLHVLLPTSDLHGQFERPIASSETHERQKSVSGGSKGLRGHFRGPSHWMNIVASFHGLHDFLQNWVQDHHLLGASRWSTEHSIAEQPRLFSSQDRSGDDMKRLTPAEQRCLNLSTAYFEHFRGLHGVLHVQTFWQEYKSYWDGVHCDPSRFNAMLLALMSCSRCLFLDDPLSYDEDGSTARNETVRWLHAVEAWLDHQKERKTTMEGFQIRCLVLFSKTINDIDSVHHYAESQVLFTDAVSNGLHRGWGGLRIEESILEWELRRKVWSAVAELDIARCIERGLPSTASNLYSDIGPPSNCNDGDYDADTQTEPTNRPESELTDNSFARFCHSIRPLRHDINDLVNNPHKHKGLSLPQREVLRQRICKGLADIPRWPESTSELAGRNQILVYRAILELHLHELLLLLHLPSVFQHSPGCPTDSDYQRFVCIRSASVIIKTHKLVGRQGFSQMALPKSNLLRAGLCVCLLETDALDQGATLLPINMIDRKSLVESVLAMVEQRTLILGTDVHSFWLLCAASCFIESCGDPDVSAACKKRITDNIIAMITKMCLTQQNTSSSFGFYDAYFARHIQQIRQICDEVDLLTVSQTTMNTYP